MASRHELTPGQWRRWLFLWPLPLVIVALLASPVLWQWKLVLVPLAVLMSLVEWRRQPLPQQLHFLADTLEITTRDGRVWQPLEPVHRFQCPLCLALRCASGRRVRWLTVYADEVSPALFARLNRYARFGAAMG